MAYNNYFPPFYSGTSYNPYQQAGAQAVPQPPLPAQIQNGGFVSASSEGYARNYPVAPGTSVAFKDENLPYLYTKTMGYSPLDPPIFEKFKLVKEEAENVQPESQTVAYALKTDIDELKGELESLRAEISRRKYQDRQDKRKGELEK